MSEPKPIASLGAGLLARKGTARPAMRPQIAMLGSHPAGDDDLGWNDMGGEAPVGPVVAAPEPAPAPAPVPPPPVVVAQQRDLARRVAAGRASALADGRRCAFTLRVDAERHLKLRLACTLHGRSAQQLITEALDQFLAASPDLADLAAHCTRAGARRRANG